jgi:hypothetical protein
MKTCKIHAFFLFNGIKEKKVSSGRNYHNNRELR